MTRKTGANDTPIKAGDQRAAQIQQADDFSLANENVLDVSDDDSEPEYNMVNYNDLPMHQFGSPSDDPGNYRNNLALREDLHFTDMMTASDTSHMPAELNALLRDEFAQSDLMDRLSDSYVQTPEYAHGPNETGSQGYGLLLRNVS